jgi:glutamyl-Q tRNA(Asp) synthetase
MVYRGRFAPSPTGPLHAGSILTAVASYLDAKANAGKWLVRIEDLDPPRIQPGAEKAILDALEAYGLESDEPIIRQSERLEIYREYLNSLVANGLAYHCRCSRSELKARNALAEYDRFCLSHPPAEGAQTGIRTLGGTSPSFIDKIQGLQAAEAVSDFIVFRRDGLFAYQLAVVIDDELQSINSVVRGKDLLSETSKQLVLQRKLNFSQHKNYAHLPLILAKDGQKLSKQTFAQPVSTDPDQIRESLINTFQNLALNPPKDLIYNEIIEIYQWGVEHWDLAKLPTDLTL